jgi:RHH-type proline utilization regulon transcriptional repressor/proline dehydrogenase/delta 1-pyrroline-5-carboxylate dehydrogenase
MPMKTSDKLVLESLELAKEWQNKANHLANSKENSIRVKLSKLLNNPEDKNTLIKMIDYSFRAKSTNKIAYQLHSVLSKYGIPKFFSTTEQNLMKLFLSIGHKFHPISIPIVINEMRDFSSSSIIKEEKLNSHLRRRKKDNVRVNLNHIGEAVLGEDEAKYRLDSYIKDLRNPEIECISIKISTIYSQINSLAFEDTVVELEERLSILYREAIKNKFTRKDGKVVDKSINLDMEEYRDLNITKELFLRTVQKEEFLNYTGGIVLQAYLPDSHEIQKEIIQVAKDRLAKGGAPLKMRIVKGANMEMEIVDSDLHNWALAPYDNKIEVDANYKRMLEYGLKKENVEALNLGVASHNLFELAFAFTLAKHNDVLPHICFEMLEGMGDHVRRAIANDAHDMLMYAPVAEKEQFINAIAYLIRRLDENTAPQNFLRYSTDLETTSPEWEFLRKIFLDSVVLMENAYNKPNRTQNRLEEKFDKVGTLYNKKFVNEPDTDFSLKANVDWAKQVREKWQFTKESEVIKIPVSIAGEDFFEGREIKQSYDLSTVKEGGDSKILVADFALANMDDAEKCIEVAKKDPDNWRKKSTEERHEILSKVAQNLREGRADLIGCTMASTGKVFTEADVEVSEAVDFAEFYPKTVRDFEAFNNIKMEGKGVGLVITPWNFPIAIPCGGVVASLAAGNTVIFKPASNAVLSAYVLCKCFWDAGISKNTLQFVPCNGSSVGAHLTKSEDVDFSILTGGTDTGLRILENNPELFLSAETGGKNATIVTAMADRDQAAKNVIYSAFGNCGQKCSATSLLILEKQIYDDPKFKEQIVDAAKSWNVGSAWDFKNAMGPMCNIPTWDLKWALTELEEGEKWLLEPKMIDNNPYLWTPGIKDNVKEGSKSHMTEFFGPVLSVMRAENLEHAIEMVNATGYGLTSGIESLNTEEQELWKSKIKAGNLYVNRGTTGAIVLRQPFGGMGNSAFGAGIKAGSPNYVSLFSNVVEKEGSEPSRGVITTENKALWFTHKVNNLLQWKDMDYREDLIKLVKAVESYSFHNEKEFLIEKDYFNLQGQDNIFRYHKLDSMIIRLHQEDTVFDILARVSGAIIADIKFEISVPIGVKSDAIDYVLGHNCKDLVQAVNVVEESDAELKARMLEFDRVRYGAPNRVPREVFEEAAKTGYYIARTKVLSEGRLEMLNYYIEQSVCDNYHRYGNLGDRSVM